MSNLVAFLEGLAIDGHLTDLSPADYAAAVAELDIAPALREALIARDADAINRLASEGSPMMMILAPGDNPPNDDQPPADNDDDKESSDG